MPTFRIVLFALALAIIAPIPNALAADESPIEVTKSSGKVQVLTEKMRIVIDISEAGIGRAELRRTGKTWPRGLKIRLHLAGMEGFRVNFGERELHWWVSHHPEVRTYMAQLRKGKETELTDKSDLWTAVNVIAGKGKMKAFEVTLPAKMLNENPETIKLNWIDFYR